MKPKILHCIWSMNTGGSEEMLLDIIERQAKVADVHLMIINDEMSSAMTSRIPDDVTVHYIGRKPGSDALWPVLKLNMLVLRLWPDVIHLHNTELPKIVLPGIAKRKVLTVHALDKTLLAYRDLKRIVAISDAVKDDIRARYGISSVVITNGIATDHVDIRPPRHYGDTLRIVQVGRLDARTKGQDILIRALSQLKERGYDDISVTLIGDGGDRDALQRLAREEGVDDMVYFLGLKDKAYIYQHLCEYDMMVHPSRWEGFGLTVAEGMAAQLPIAVPIGGGPYEVTGRGRYAVTFETDNIDACADAIAYAHDNYGNLLDRVTEARSYVDHNFSINSTVDGYLALYRSL